jgi:transposase
MPKLLKVEPSPEQRAELRRRLHERDLAPHTRMRLECLHLSDKAMTVPQVAGLAEVHPAAVRKAIKRFMAAGFAALADAPRCGRPPQLQQADPDASETMPDACTNGGPSWTAPQLADWLQGQRGVHISPSRLTALVRADGFGWKRTRDTLRHKADPVLQQAARARLEEVQPCSSKPMPPRSTCPTWTRAGSPRPCPPAAPGRAPASVR